MKLIKLAAIPVIALAASAFTFAPSAYATVKPPPGKTCTTTTVTTYKTEKVVTHKWVKVVTHRWVNHHWALVVTYKRVEVITYKSVPVVTKTKVCTKTPTPMPTPTSISVGPISFQQAGCAGYVPNINSNPIYGAVGVLTWTDIDTNINGVRVADNGPTTFGPLPYEGTRYAAFLPVLMPGTYAVTLDLRSGSTILATSAPVEVVVPALVGC